VGAGRLRLLGGLQRRRDPGLGAWQDHAALILRGHLAGSDPRRGNRPGGLQRVGEPAVQPHRARGIEGGVDGVPDERMAELVALRRHVGLQQPGLEQLVQRRQRGGVLQLRDLGHDREREGSLEAGGGIQEPVGRWR
jgi:hypothetical protein